MILFICFGLMVIIAILWLFRSISGGKKKKEPDSSIIGIPFKGSIQSPWVSSSDFILHGDRFTIGKSKQYVAIDPLIPKAVAKKKPDPVTTIPFHKDYFSLTVPEIPDYRSIYRNYYTSSAYINWRADQEKIRLKNLAAAEAIEAVVKKTGEVKTMDTIWKCGKCGYSYVGAESIVPYDWCTQCVCGKLEKQPAEMYNEFGIGTVPMGLPSKEAQPMEDMTRIYPISKRVEQGPDPEVIEAIEGSIVKWQDIMGGGEDMGTDNCPLCHTFNCTTCPVSKFLGKEGCIPSPYGKWLDHQEDAHQNKSWPKIIQCPECAGIAYAEIEFLREILQKEKGKMVEQTDQFFVKVEEYGEGLRIIACDKDGEKLRGGNFFRITQEGIRLIGFIEPSIGFELDEKGQLNVY